MKQQCGYREQEAFAAKEHWERKKAASENGVSQLPCAIAVPELHDERLPLSTRRVSSNTSAIFFSIKLYLQNSCTLYCTLNKTRICEF